MGDEPTPAAPDAADGSSSDVTRDRWGFEVPAATLDYQRAQEAKHAKRDKKLEKEWSAIVQSAKWKTSSSKALRADGKMKRLCRQGVPRSLRSQVWMKLSGAAEKQLIASGYYASLLEMNAGTDTKATEQIEMDIDRTFPACEYFQRDEGRNALRNVLRAYSFRNAEIGYCQSMNFLVGMLLRIVQEEEAFWLLTIIIEELLPVDYLGKTLSGSHADTRTLETLLHTKVPKLAAHFAAMSLPMEIIASQWFLCCFSNSVPRATCFRIFDAFLFEGSKVLFRVALAIFRRNQEVLLKTSDAGEVLTMAKLVAANEHDADALMDVAFHKVGSLPMKKIGVLRQGHRETVQAEQEELQRRREAYQREMDAAADA